MLKKKKVLHSSHVLISEHLQRVSYKVTHTHTACTVWQSEFTTFKFDCKNHKFLGRIFVTHMLFYGLFNQQTEAIFQRKGKKNATELRHFDFLFSQICVNVKSSEAREAIRPTLIFMVHDIGQIYAKPHIRQKGTMHSLVFFLFFFKGELHCCGCFAFVISLFCISFFFFPLQTACAMHF